MSKTQKEINRKYHSKMSQLIKEQLEKEIFDALAAGKNSYMRLDRLASSSFDKSWIEVIEGVIFDLGEIIANPRLNTKVEGNIVPVELARKTGAESVQHLSSHTQYIKEIDEYGNVIPSKIMTMVNEDDIKTYENRFIATFVRRLLLFVEKRYEFVSQFAVLRNEEMLFVKNKSFVDGAEVEIETKIKVSYPNEDEMGLKSNAYIERIAKIREFILYFYNSSFMKQLKTERDVRNPILQTNIIRKNPKYHHCYEVYKFIEGYDQLGVNYKVDENFSIFNQEELDEINRTLFANYITLKGKELSHDHKTYTKVYKPKILTSSDDEMFVYGPLLNGPISFVRVDEPYQAYLDSKLRNDLPLHPTKKEKEYYADEYKAKALNKEDQKQKENLLKRKAKEQKDFEKSVEKVLSAREKARLELEAIEKRIIEAEENARLAEARKHIVAASLLEKEAVELKQDREQLEKEQQALEEARKALEEEARRLREEKEQIIAEAKQAEAEQKALEEQSKADNNEQPAEELESSNEEQPQEETASQESPEESLNEQPSEESSNEEVPVAPAREQQPVEPETVEESTNEQPSKEQSLDVDEKPQEETPQSEESSNNEEQPIEQPQGSSEPHVIPTPVVNESQDSNEPVQEESAKEEQPVEESQEASESVEPATTNPEISESQESQEPVQEVQSAEEVNEETKAEEPVMDETAVESIKEEQPQEDHQPNDNPDVVVPVIEETSSSESAENAEESIEQSVESQDEQFSNEEVPVTEEDSKEDDQPQEEAAPEEQPTEEAQESNDNDNPDIIVVPVLEEVSTSEPSENVEEDAEQPVEVQEEQPSIEEALTAEEQPQETMESSEESPAVEENAEQLAESIATEPASEQSAKEQQESNENAQPDVVVVPVVEEVPSSEQNEAQSSKEEERPVEEVASNEKPLDNNQEEETKESDSSVEIPVFVNEDVSGINTPTNAENEAINNEPSKKVGVIIHPEVSDEPIKGKFIIHNRKGYYVNDNEYSAEQNEAYIFDEYQEAKKVAKVIGGKIIKIL